MIDLSGKHILILGQSEWAAALSNTVSKSGAAVTSASDMSSLVDRLKQPPGYDGAILKASWRSEMSFLESTPQDWQAALTHNFEQVVFAAQAVARHMIAHETKGRIIIVSSAAGLKPYCNLSMTGTSLAALHAIARVAAVDLGVYGVTINVVAAGWPIDDPGLQAAVPLGRVIQANDVGDVCCFLVSDAAAFITGAIIPVDGGYSITKAGAAMVMR